MKFEKVRLGNAMRKYMEIENNKYTKIPSPGKTLIVTDLRSLFYCTMVLQQPVPSGHP